MSTVIAGVVLTVAIVFVVVWARESRARARRRARRAELDEITARRHGWPLGNVDRRDGWE